MRYVKGLINHISDRPCAVTIGKMDALHRGHRLLIEKIKKIKDCSSVVIIFSVSPRVVIGNGCLEPSFVITDDERKAMLDDMDIDELLEIEFGEETITTEPEDFIRSLKESLDLRYLCVGDDFRFGYRGRGNVSMLNALSAEMDFEFEAVERISYEGDIISSSRIRDAIECGHIKDANAMLGYEYFFAGEVVHGNQIGRTIGFPTINLEPESDKIIPTKGVYATRIDIGGKRYSGMTNIGTRPTVDEKSQVVTIETYIFDFSEDVYGQHVRLSFVDYVRPEMVFDGLEGLKKQILQDQTRIRGLLGC